MPASHRNDSSASQPSRGTPEGRGPCPWCCRVGAIEYDAADYPRANEFVASHVYVFDVNPPNGLELLELYAAAFEKVMGGLDQVLA
ncbi:MAG: hypothetical protein ISS72_05395 [Candidatus Brocadiae bacterium]|nr:hypothetical protein [Candidatus Brocadiia bacterium]